MFLWPYSHKDQIFLAFWYKFKQDILKEVKIQMKFFCFKPLSLFVRFIVEFNMTLLKTFSVTNLDTLVSTYAYAKKAICIIPNEEMLKIPQYSQLPSDLLKNKVLHSMKLEIT